ncbi:MAG: PPC domain-containing protein [Acidobacteriota bacterium]
MSRSTHSPRKLGGVSGLVLVFSLGLAGAALAGSGGPDTFGYTWIDSDEAGCDALLPTDGRTLATEGDFFNGASFDNFQGPFPLTIDFPWYERVPTEWFIHRNGLVFFDTPPDTTLNSPMNVPTMGDGPLGFLAAYWDFLGVERPSYWYQYFPAEDLVQIRMRATTVFTGTSVEFDVYLYEGGDVRIHFSDPPNMPRNGTIGTESFDETGGLPIQEIGMARGGLMMPDDGPFAICLDRVSTLDCAAATPISCGVTMGTSPGMLAGPVGAYGCSGGVSYDGNEVLYAIDLPFLGDIDVTLEAGGRDMAVFVLGACDEWNCLGGGGLTGTADTLAPGRYYIVVDALTPGDEGAFTLTVNCTELSVPIACEEMRSGTTVGEPNRLRGYPCLPTDSDGPDFWYSVDVPAASNLSVRVTSGSGTLGAVILPAGAEFRADNCLLGGTPSVTLFGPTPGTYLVGVDGPAGPGEAYDIEIACQPVLDCATAVDLSCGSMMMADTSAGAADIDVYPCSASVYDGPEQVYRFVNPVRQPLSIVLDDSMTPGLDLLFLDACNEGNCTQQIDSELVAVLPAGEYFLVVDGVAGSAGPYTLSIDCPNTITPEVVSFTGGPGECIDEAKSVSLNPQLSRTDVLFAIDLTNGMGPEQNRFEAELGDILDALAAAVPDLAYGLVSFRDYDTDGIGMIGCAYNASRYGRDGDYPYRLEQPITNIRALMTTAVNGLPGAAGGGDGFESYTRVVHEARVDDSIGWREGSRRVLITLGDNMAHDCNFLECVGGVASFPSGADVGRDAIPDTGDELVMLDEIDALAAAGISLIHLHSSPFGEDSGFSYFEIWDCWAQRTGGRALMLEEDGAPSGGGSLADLIAGELVALSNGCSTLRMQAEPGFEDWLVDPGETLSMLALPLTADFDIRICIPEGTPEGDVTFEVQARCSGALSIAQTVQVTVDECAPDGVMPPPDRMICPGDATTLDASGMTLETCPGGTPEFEWFDEGGMSLGTMAMLDVMPMVDSIYSVRVTCSTDPTCYYVRTVSVTVDAPSFETATAADPSDCFTGVDLSWEAASFPRGGGVYNVYRSTIDCADAVMQPPVATGLTDLTFTDMTTMAGTTYHYVIEAEDGAGSACLPQGPGGGAAARVCVMPIEDVAGGGSVPDGVFDVLRVSHVGDEVTVSWAASRALLADEEFYLLKAVDLPTNPFSRVNPMGDTTLEYTETDLGSPVQFFDLRVSNTCGAISEDEYPPGP